MRRIIKQHLPATGLVLVVVDAVILLIAVMAGIVLRFADAPEPFADLIVDRLSEAVALVLVTLLSLVTLGAYHLDCHEDFRYSLLRLAVALLFSFAAVSLIYYIFPSSYLGRGVLAIAMLLASMGIFVLHYVVHKRKSRENLVGRILVLGCGRLAKECSELMQSNPEGHRFKIVGFLPVPNEKAEIDTSLILPSDGSLMDMVERFDISEVVVAVRNRRGSDFPVEQLLECKLAGVNVCDTFTFFEREARQIRIEYLQPSWLIFGGGFDQSFLRTSIKRDFDIIASLILMLATLPVMLITALCIALEGVLTRDRGPIFYKQERVGLNGESFMVLKFRSMRMDAEKFGVPQFATEKDPRVTRVGRFTRLVRIDELPQIINVFKGEMSFVGPRPERPYFVKQFCEEIPYYNVRHSIKPGITGWAQVRYQYGASIDDTCEKLQYDLYYVKHNSLFLDILILWDTVKVVLLGKGAR